jgi:hypothetical protein
MNLQMSGAVPGPHGGEMYLVHSGTGSVDGDGMGLSHTIRASPATVLLILYFSSLLRLFHLRDAQVCYNSFDASGTWSYC